MIAGDAIGGPSERESRKSGSSAGARSVGYRGFASVLEEPGHHVADMVPAAEEHCQDTHRFA